MRRLAWIAFAFVTAGCQSSLPDPSVVTDLRILGVRAEPAEVRPGLKIDFTALVADPNGHSRPLRRVWAICTPGDGGVGSCGDPSRTAVLGTGVTAEWSVPADLLADLDATGQLIGRDVFVVYATSVDDGSGTLSESAPHDIAFKRVRISTSPAPNTNPSIAKLLVGGAEVDGAKLPASQPAEMLVSLDPGSSQTWSSPDGASGVENIRFTWLITAGSVDDDVSWAETTTHVANRWHLPDSATTATLWVVARDGRGGTDWVSRSIRISP